MGLVDRLLEPIKDYISFRDLLFRLSSLNNEPLYDVITHLLHHDLNSMCFYNIDMNYKIIKFKPNEFDSVTEFLKEIQNALFLTDEAWVWSNPASINELSEFSRNAITTTVSKAMHCFFKKSELLIFEPLNGLLHFEDVDVERTVKDEIIESPIERRMEDNRRKYVAVNDFVNDLSKGRSFKEGGSFGAGNPLKITVEEILEKNLLSDINLYKLRGTEYLLISQTDDFKYKNSADILQSVYDILDDDQTGTVKSDREPFKDFYFAYSEVVHMIDSDVKTVEKESSIHIDKQSSANNTKPSDNSSVINNLGENQRLLITYAFFTASDMTCLIIDENPAYINNDANYLRHHRMVCNAIAAGSLVPNDTDQIPAEQVKTWLANHNFIYKNFNDNLSNDRDKMGIAVVGHVIKTYDQLVDELATANNTIKDLKNKPAQVEAVKYSYTTPAMEIMDAVINEFWINYSPGQPAPKQSTITEWITANFKDISSALALNIDKVCRHSDARGGGQYKRS